MPLLARTTRSWSQTPNLDKLPPQGPNGDSPLDHRGISEGAGRCFETIAVLGAVVSRWGSTS